MFAIQQKPNGKYYPKLTRAWSFKETFRSLHRRNRFQLKSSHFSDSLQDSNEECFYFPASKCDVWRALSPNELPEDSVFALLPLNRLSPDLFASYTGPTSGLQVVNKWLKQEFINPNYCPKWKTIHNRKACGICVSLYESNLTTHKPLGHPIADSFVLRARNDSAFLAVADGVNWGRESMRAARSAIYAVYERLETNLYQNPGQDNFSIRNTRDAAQFLFETFSYAHDLIVKLTTGLTTLCVALVLPLAETEYSAVLDAVSIQANRFALIVVSVGDSQAFLLSKFHGIRELTGSVQYSSQFSMDANPEKLKQSASLFSDASLRDFRDTGGALGAVYENGNAELNNLMCAVTICDPGDIVLLGTDGLFDNFDPVVTKLAMPESPQLEYMDDVDDIIAGKTEESNSIGSSISSSEQSLITGQQLRAATSWVSPLSLISSVRMNLWPKPPPPPELAGKCDIHSLATGSNDICATQLNFTNQLELNWSERKKYASKEIERLWHELDIDVAQATTPINGENQVNTLSSRDLCEVLINYVVQMTKAKREMLEGSATQKLWVSDMGSSNKKHKQDILKRLPGKLDHATVVAYEVGIYHGNENEVYEEMAHRFVVPKPQGSPTLNSEP